MGAESNGKEPRTRKRWSRREEKRRSGRHEIDKDGEKKRGDGRLGSTAYEKKVRISNSQAEEGKEENGDCARQHKREKDHSNVNKHITREAIAINQNVKKCDFVRFEITRQRQDAGKDADFGSLCNKNIDLLTKTTRYGQ